MIFDVTTIYYIFLILLVFYLWIGAFLEYLNKTRWSDELPLELSEIYDEEKYKKSMSYEKEKYIFSKYSNIFSSALIFIFVLFWLFWKIFDYIISFWFWEFFSTLIFFLVLFLAQSFLNLPFSYYYTFVIEQKYWFYKITYFDDYNLMNIAFNYNFYLFFCMKIFLGFGLVAYGLIFNFYVDVLF